MESQRTSDNRVTNRNRVSKPFLKLWGELFVSVNRDSAVSVFQLSFPFQFYEVCSNHHNSDNGDGNIRCRHTQSAWADQSQKPSTTLSDKEKEMMKRCL